MISSLTEFLQTITWSNLILAAGLFLTSLALSILAIGVAMVKLPENYFSTHYRQDFLPNSPWLVRWGAVILKNIAGIFLILLGILLSLPGIPGQGVLTILLGLIFIDIPGKRPLEARIIKQPAILSTVNALRQKYGKPPFQVD